MSALKGERWAEPVYLDASALVKLFVPEPESDDLDQALAGLTDAIVSDLSLTEMTSAVGRRTREQRLTREEAQRLYREASKLHALDALHLATALDAQAATVVTFDPRVRDADGSQRLFVSPSNA
jgi:predicted nucleic acid-binding protein